MSRREPSTSPPHAEPTAGPAATPASAGSAAGGADVTGLLIAWSEGDRASLDALLPVVYAELRRQARRALRREAVGHTLQPTALVHEAYLRLVDQGPIRWQGRTQFFGQIAGTLLDALLEMLRLAFVFSSTMTSPRASRCQTCCASTAGAPRVGRVRCAFRPRRAGS